MIFKLIFSRCAWGMGNFREQLKVSFQQKWQYNCCSLTYKCGRPLSAWFATLKILVIALIMVYLALVHIPKRFHKMLTVYLSNNLGIIFFSMFNFLNSRCL